MNDPTGLERWRARVAAEKRGALLDAATALFLAEGYDGTTLEAVAKRAGVSSATLHKHFPTKADLFAGIMARMWETGGAETPGLPAPGAPRDGLRRIGDAYAALLRRSETVALFRLVIAEAPRFPELGRDLYEHGKRPYLDRLHEYLGNEVAAATLRIDDIPLAARQFLGMINDVIFWPRLLVVDLEIDDRETDRVVAAAVETFLARHAA